MPSLKDLAKECGVSVATVSKALNNHHDIGEETKESASSGRNSEIEEMQKLSFQ